MVVVTELCVFREVSFAKPYQKDRSCMRVLQSCLEKRHAFRVALNV